MFGLFDPLPFWLTALLDRICHICLVTLKFDDPPSPMAVNVVCERPLSNIIPMGTLYKISYDFFYFAVLVTSHPTPPHSASVYQNTKTKFTFPDPPITIKMQPDPSQIPLIPSSKATSPNPIIDSVRSNDSDKTLSGTYN